MISIFLFVACTDSSSEKLLPSSNGKYGEVLVVIDSNLEKGKVGEVLNEIFYESLNGLPQKESQFRMSSVHPSGFQSVLKKSKNLLKVEVKKEGQKNVQIVNDVWAKDQLLLKITAGDQASLERILRKNKQTIRDYFNEEELKRLQKQQAKKRESKIEKDILQQIGIEIKVPAGFVQMMKSDQGLWIKKEKTIGQHQVIQGLSIYSYPYTSDSTFSVAELIEKRNAFTLQHIEGFRDSSYMVVYEEYSPNVKEINLDENYAIEYRGLWKMENDFMGGPFLHYTLVDQKNNTVINLDGFVYAPKFEKREYLRELEAIMKTISIN